MAMITANLLEVFQLGEKTAGILDLPTRFWPEPGQYLPCQLYAGVPDFLNTHLFRVIGPKNRLCLGLLPENWHPGDRIAFQPPQGKGFKVPATARRVGLLTLSRSPERLLTLVELCLEQDAAVSLFCDTIIFKNFFNRLPPIVEVAPITSLQDNLDWPDYLAVDIHHSEQPSLSGFFGLAKGHFEGQVLIQTDMPCRGIGECGACAVKTQHGWRLACVDGPVFPLQEVLHVA